MISWSLVLEQLNNHLKSINKYDPLFDDLEAVLLYLYKEKKLSTKQIIELTNGKCSACSLRTKMKELGIKLRSKGGPNYTKPFKVSKKEYKESSYKEMALKYKVHMSTIRSRCQKYIETNGKKRRSK